MKHKKNIFTGIIISFIAMIGLAIGLGTQVNQVNASTVAEIKAKGEIVMGTSPDYPPYEFIATVDGKQKAIGMDISIGEQFAKDLGVKLVIKQMDFDSLLVGLETGKIDFSISGLTPTNERKKSADFSKVYYQADQYFVVNKNDKKLYKNFHSLSEKKIGVQTGSLQLKLAKEQMPQAKLTQMTKITDLILALKSHKTDALLMESTVAIAYAAHDDDLAYIKSGLVQGYDMEGTAIAFPKNSPELVAAANKTIDQIHEKDSITKYLADAGDYLKPAAKKENSWLIVAKYWKYFANGLGYTILVTVVSAIFGVVLGILFALLRLVNSKFVNNIVKAIVEFIRGTPLMIQLMFVYFGLSKMLNVDISPLLAGFIAVSINSAAYVSEIIRGGINSVDAGQGEAARSLGLSKKESMQSIILPQAIKNIWPALGNEFISLIKETSIVSIIGVSDLIFQLRAVQAATYQGIIPIVIAMLIYFIITYGLSKLLNFYERRMNHGNN